MPRRSISLMAMIGLIFTLGIGCTQVVMPTASPSATVPTRLAVQTPSQGEWEKTLAAAKNEATISVATNLGADVRVAISKAFTEKYGIQIDYLAAAPAEIQGKVSAERRSGIYTYDLVLAAALTQFQIIDFIEPMEKVLILPEVRDVNAWRDKTLPFFDKEGRIFMYLGRVGAGILVNTDLVNPEEMKSWNNLLEPRWKEKILLDDPSVSGPTNAVVTAAGDIMGISFLRELAKQDPTIVRDKRLNVEWVARGKYPIAVGYAPETVEEFQNVGAHIVPVVPVEGTVFGSGIGSMGMFSRGPHPNAAKAFLNWFLTKEGQTVYVKVARDQSNRVDVQSALGPERQFRQGVKYFYMDTEYAMKKQLEMLTLSRDIFAAQYK